MQKKETRSQIIALAFITTMLISFNVCIGQCKDFHLREYEKICTLNFENLKKFTLASGYSLIAASKSEPINKSTIIKCGLKNVVVVKVNEYLLIKVPTDDLELFMYEFPIYDYKITPTSTDENVKMYTNSEFAIRIDNKPDQNNMILVKVAPIYKKTEIFKKCQELSISNLENLCKLDFEQLNIFLKQKGLSISKNQQSSESAFVQCENTPLFIVTINDKVEFFEKSSTFAENFIKQIKLKGYKFFDSNGDMAIYRSLVGAVIIKTSTTEGNYIRIQPFKKESSTTTDNETDKVYAKKVNANRITVDSYTNTTDIIIKKGEEIDITATGSITYGAWAGSGGPEGINGYTSYNRIQAFRHGCLLARIGDNGEWKAVGSESYRIRADKDGVLQFIVNDNDPSNNSGNFTVDLLIITRDGELRKVYR